MYKVGVPLRAIAARMTVDGIDGTTVHEFIRQLELGHVGAETSAPDINVHQLCTSANHDLPALLSAVRQECTALNLMIVDSVMPGNGWTEAEIDAVRQLMMEIEGTHPVLSEAPRELLKYLRLATAWGRHFSSNTTRAMIRKLHADGLGDKELELRQHLQRLYDFMTSGSSSAAVDAAAGARATSPPEGTATNRVAQKIRGGGAGDMTKVSGLSLDALVTLLQVIARDNDTDDLRETARGVFERVGGAAAATAGDDDDPPAPGGPAPVIRRGDLLREAARWLRIRGPNAAWTAEQRAWAFCKDTLGMNPLGLVVAVPDVSPSSSTGCRHVPEALQQPLGGPFIWRHPCVRSFFLDPLLECVATPEQRFDYVGALAFWSSALSDCAARASDDAASAAMQLAAGDLGAALRWFEAQDGDPVAMAASARALLARVAAGQLPRFIFLGGFRPEDDTQSGGAFSIVFEAESARTFRVVVCSGGGSGSLYHPHCVINARHLRVAEALELPGIPVHRVLVPPFLDVLCQLLFRKSKWHTCHVLHEVLLPFLLQLAPVLKHMRQPACMSRMASPSLAKSSAAGATEFLVRYLLARHNAEMNPIVTLRVTDTLASHVKASWQQVVESGVAVTQADSEAIAFIVHRLARCALEAKRASAPHYIIQTAFDLCASLKSLSARVGCVFTRAEQHHPPGPHGIGSGTACAPPQASATAAESRELSHARSLIGAGLISACQLLAQDSHTTATRPGATAPAPTATHQVLDAPPAAASLDRFVSEFAVAASRTYSVMGLEQLVAWHTAQLTALVVSPRPETAAVLSATAGRWTAETHLQFLSDLCAISTRLASVCVPSPQVAIAAWGLFATGHATAVMMRGSANHGAAAFARALGDCPVDGRTLFGRPLAAESAAWPLGVEQARTRQAVLGWLARQPTASDRLFDFEKVGTRISAAMGTMKFFATVAGDLLAGAAPMTWSLAQLGALMCGSGKVEPPSEAVGLGVASSPEMGCLFRLRDLALGAKFLSQPMKAAPIADTCRTLTTPALADPDDSFTWELLVWGDREVQVLVRVAGIDVGGDHAHRAARFWNAADARNLVKSALHGGPSAMLSPPLSEVDVYFVQRLDTLRGRITPSQAESLMVALGASALRCSLLVDFFSRNVSLLFDPTAQQILRAVLLQPGPWDAGTDLRGGGDVDTSDRGGAGAPQPLKPRDRGDDAADSPCVAAAGAAESGGHPHLLERAVAFETSALAFELARFPDALLGAFTALVERLLELCGADSVDSTVSLGAIVWILSLGASVEEYAASYGPSEGARPATGPHRGPPAREALGALLRGKGADVMDEVITASRTRICAQQQEPDRPPMSPTEQEAFLTALCAVGVQLYFSGGFDDVRNVSRIAKWAALALRLSPRLSAADPLWGIVAHVHRFALQRLPQTGRAAVAGGAEDEACRVVCAATGFAELVEGQSGDAWRHHRGTAFVQTRTGRVFDLAQCIVATDSCERWPELLVNNAHVREALGGTGNGVAECCELKPRELFELRHNKTGDVFVVALDAPKPADCEWPPPMGFAKDPSAGPWPAPLDQFLGAHAADVASVHASTEDSSVVMIRLQSPAPGVPPWLIATLEAGDLVLEVYAPTGIGSLLRPVYTSDRRVSVFELAPNWSLHSKFPALCFSAWGAVCEIPESFRSLTRIRRLRDGAMFLPAEFLGTVVPAGLTADQTFWIRAQDGAPPIAVLGSRAHTIELQNGGAVVVRDPTRGLVLSRPLEHRHFRSVCSQLWRADHMSHSLLWDDAAGTGAGHQPALVHLLRLGVTFTTRAPDGRLALESDPDYAICAPEGHTVPAFARLPFGLLLRHAEHRLAVLMPLTAVAVAHEASSGTRVVQARPGGRARIASALMSVHPTGQHVVTEDAASALFLSVCALLSGRYADAFVYAHGGIVHQSFTSGERWVMHDVLPQSFGDVSPAAAACRLKIFDMAFSHSGEPRPKHWNFMQDCVRYVCGVECLESPC